MALALWEMEKQKRKQEQLQETIDQIKNLPSAEDKANTTQFFMFSPFLMSVDEGFNLFGFDYSQFIPLMLVATVYRLSKTSEGLKFLRDIFVQYFKTTSVILGELGSAGSSNWLTAIVNAKLAIPICRRLGLMSATEANALNAKYSWIFDRMSLIEGIEGTLTGLGTFAKGITGLIPKATSE